MADEHFKSAAVKMVFWWGTLAKYEIMDGKTVVNEKWAIQLLKTS